MSDAATRARELLDKATPGPWVADGLEGNLDAPSGRVAEVILWGEPDAELIAAAPTLLAELADEVERLQAKVDAFADIEEAHSASYRMLRDQSGMTELVAEVNRLRALATVDDAMVERAAREIELHAPSYRPINWPDDHRELARVALEAALGVES